jgi:glucose 1-dehydrogenase
MSSNIAELFKGKVALVTGASSGIGRATALTLAEHGADLAINYLTMPEEAEATARSITQLGKRCLLAPADVSNQETVEAMVANVVKELGRIDLLVTAAVYSDREPFTTANMAGFHKTVDVSMWGAFYTLRAVANQMIKQGEGGAVVVVSSPHAVIPFPNCMAYNIAKAGLDAMARSAAIELIHHNIRVNIFHPGWTNTPGERKFFSEEALNAASKAQPMGRLASSEEMAHGILFQLHPMSSYMSGSVLTMDGGLNLPFWSKRGTGDF